MAKKVDWIVHVEEVRSHELKVKATTESAAEKAALKMMKGGRRKAKAVSYEVVEVVEEGYEEEDDWKEWEEEEEEEE